MKLKGFTLLEMIVAVGVFSVVAVLAVGSLLTLTSAQKKATALQSVQDNLRFALDSMVRDIQTGDFYYCGNFSELPPDNELPIPRDCLLSDGGGKILTFINQYGKLVTYRWSEFSSGVVAPSCVDRYCIEKAERNGTRAGYSEPYQFVPVTSQSIHIETLTFYVAGTGYDDNIEPRITIVIEGVSGSGRDETRFHLQSTVSQRKVFRR